MTATFLRRLSAILFVSAIAAMLTLLVSDVFNKLALTKLHRNAGALSFVLIGGSYLALLLGCERKWNKKWKNILLAIGFLFWGSAQLLPASSWVAAMDTAVVLIFVMDLSAVILDSLKSKKHE